MLFTSPFEQFILIPIFSSSIDITSFTVINNIIFISIFSLALIFNFSDKIELILFTKNKINLSISTIFNNSIKNLVKTTLLDNIRDNTRLEFGLIWFNTSSLILLLNIVGTIPYAPTITSSLINCLILSSCVCISSFIISARRYKLQVFNNFLPNKTNLLVAIFLVPIEFIAWSARPISMGMRLFVNMVAGHVLLKIASGLFYFLIMGSYTYIIFLIPCIIFLLCIYFLELCVAVIQGYVFSVLFCVYIYSGLQIH